jgi:cytochrome c oxidase assembly factor CtaG
VIEHMLVHAAIASVVAPALVLLGPAVFRALSRRARRIAVRASLALTEPRIAWPLFVAAMWVLNIPSLVDWLDARPVVHLAGHGLMLGAAILFWLPVLGHPRRLTSLAAGAYLLLATMASDLIGAWYMAMGRTGAGVAMVAGMLPLAAAAVVLTWAGLKREEQRAVRWETYADAAR